MANKDYGQAINSFLNDKGISTDKISQTLKKETVSFLKNTNLDKNYIIKTIENFSFEKPLKKEEIKYTRKQYLGFFFTLIIGGGVLIGISFVLMFGAIKIAFKNKNLPVTAEQISYEDACTKEHLKEKFKDKIIYEDDLIVSRRGCDINSLKIKDEQNKALKN